MLRLILTYKVYWQNELCQTQEAFLVTSNSIPIPS
jgi:hypothetical protein